MLNSLKPENQHLLQSSPQHTNFPNGLILSHALLMISVLNNGKSAIKGTPFIHPIKRGERIKRNDPYPCGCGRSQFKKCPVFKCPPDIQEQIFEDSRRREERMKKRK